MLQMKRFSVLLSIITLLVLILAACGGAGSTEPAAAPAVEPAAESNTDVAQEISVAGTPEEDTAESSTGLRTFIIVPEESRASYLVDEEFLENALSKLGIEAGNNDVVGSTQAVEGQLQLNPDDLSAALGENTFAVDLTTLQTDQDRRDKWIRENGPTFNKFPTATFTATSISGLPDSYDEGAEIQFQVNGDLTVRGVSVPITLDVKAKLQGNTLSGVAETTRHLTDFGIDPPDFAKTLTVADEFGIRVEFTAQEE